MPKNENQRYILRQGYFPAGDQPEQARAVKPQRLPFPIWRAVVILAAVLVIAAAAILAPRLFSGSAPASWSGADLAGSWAIASSNGSAFVAEISQDMITINWSTDGTQALYWSGSFVVPAGSEITKTVISAASPANSTALMASGDPQKTFTVTRSEIQFDASMMGTTRRFSLRRK